jgi:hypothetical protein
MGVKPTLTAAPGSYVVTWCFPGVRVDFEADRIRTSQSRGTVQARLRVNEVFPDRVVPLHHANINLAAGQTRHQLASAFEERFPRKHINWDQLIEESCRLILEREEQGFAVERLTATDRLEPEYLLAPLIMDGVANLIFAPGGSGKSYLGLYVALLAENGLDLDLQPGRQTNTLFLDFETSRAETGRRCTLLAAGIERRLVGRRLSFPTYGRGVGVLADRTSDVARVIAEHAIGLVLIDSAGAAAGGDILSAETAVRFFEAVRVVTEATGAAALIFSHVTKTDSRQDDAHRAPVGSVFFTNLSRLVWELRSEELADGLQVGLFCRKANAGRPAPVGFRFIFDRGAVVVERAPVKDVRTDESAIRDMILSELEHGACGPSELAATIGTTPGTISKTLTALKDKGLVKNAGRGSWVLAGERGAA